MRPPVNDLTASELRAVLRCDPQAGKLFWIDRLNGAEAGYIAPNGYRAIMIGKRSYLAHRLVWLHVYGCWPEHCIDHINGDKLDNRISNLRDATHQMNMTNRRTARGVRPTYKGGSRFRAVITRGGVARNLGTFATEAEARAAYNDAASRDLDDQLRRARVPSVNENPSRNDSDLLPGVFCRMRVTSPHVGQSIMRLRYEHPQSTDNWSGSYVRAH